MRRVMKIVGLLVVIIGMGSTVYASKAHKMQEHTLTKQTGAASLAKEKAVENQFLGEAVVATAIVYTGVPYVWGGASPDGFDCSGFIWYVFDQYGIDLPRTADLQFGVGQRVSYKNLRPGDVLFFTTYAPGPSHCGIYAGGGRFIHASSSQGIIIAEFKDVFWKRRYLGARRMISS